MTLEDFTSEEKERLYQLHRPYQGRSSWNADKLENQIFGRLTVLYKLEKKDKAKHSYWLCHCTCGNFSEVSGTRLKTGITTSCGCYKQEKAKNQLIDITGQHFGKLTVLKYEKHIGKDAAWRCKCDCGNETIVIGYNLKDGHTKSCGCSQHRSYGEEKIHNLLKEHNISFSHEYTDPQYPNGRFDFYVNNQYYIEYDGIQHFDTKNNWYRPGADQNKNAYCIKHNIPLIRIPYTRYDKLCIEDLLLETSSFILKEDKNVTNGNGII